MILGESVGAQEELRPVIPSNLRDFFVFRGNDDPIDQFGAKSVLDRVGNERLGGEIHQVLTRDPLEPPRAGMIAKTVIVTSTRTGNSKLRAVDDTKTPLQ